MTRSLVHNVRAAAAVVVVVVMFLSPATAVQRVSIKFACSKVQRSRSLVCRFCRRRHQHEQRRRRRRRRRRRCVRSSVHPSFSAVPCGARCHRFGDTVDQIVRWVCDVCAFMVRRMCSVHAEQRSAIMMTLAEQRSCQQKRRGPYAGTTMFQATYGVQATIEQGKSGSGVKRI